MTIREEGYAEGYRDGYSKRDGEIVRCKDCKYCREAHYEEDGETPIIKLKCENKYGLCRYQAEPDGFCSQGERKEGDGE